MIQADGVIYILALSHEEEEEPKSVFWAFDTSKEFYHMESLKLFR